MLTGEEPDGIGKIGQKTRVVARKQLRNGRRQPQVLEAASGDLSACALAVVFQSSLCC